MRGKDKEFSKGFFEDVQDILKLCAEEKTNNCDLTLEFDCGKLNMHIVFSVDHTEDEDE